ncbi:phosphatase 2C-like domain-containing protein [Tribonema minus]|uniref:Protein phosphatase n=1 Tax=Tribonema minus TaxID=303371 RepID=A0A835Z8H6_9STRA|nr:phosphatase 2C-like domain-containing protein [Tribonema minus]
MALRGAALLLMASLLAPVASFVQPGGEDAFFLLPKDIGVFDGVGGFRKLGVDPAAFSRAFAAAAAHNITAQRARWEAIGGGGGGSGAQTVATFKGVDLRLALEHALSSALRGTRGGGCTACVASFDAASGLLTGANLGDSGLAVLRRDLSKRMFVAYRTTPQQHRFNMPYQLGTNSTDTPADAVQFRFYTRPGDVIVLATDGLFDNLFDEDIVETVAALLRRKHAGHAAAPVTPEAIAACLVLRAVELSADRERESPWHRAAAQARLAARRRRRASGAAAWRSFTRRLGELLGELEPGTRALAAYEGPAYEGGKLDDITVVVACVSGGGGGGGSGGGSGDGSGG